MSVTNQKGTSLIEVLLATFLIVGAVVTMSLVFPKMSKNVVLTRQNWVAGNLTASQVSLLKGKSYAYLEMTDSSLFGPIANCDCSLIDFSLLPSSTTVIDGVTYNVATCVNYVSPDSVPKWLPGCPEGGDTGYKSALVRTIWGQGTDAHVVTQAVSLSHS